MCIDSIKNIVILIVDINARLFFFAGALNLDVILPFPIKPDPRIAFGSLPCESLGLQRTVSDVRFGVSATNTSAMFC